MASNGLCKPREIVMRYLIYLSILIFVVSCSDTSSTSEVIKPSKEEKYNWRLVTSWPKNYPGLGMAPERIADLVEEMSD